MSSRFDIALGKEPPPDKEPNQKSPQGIQGTQGNTGIQGLTDSQGQTGTESGHRCLVCGQETPGLLCPECDRGTGLMAEQIREEEDQRILDMLLQRSARTEHD